MASQIMLQQSQQLMGDGSQTVYSTQYNQHLKNLQNQASKLSDGVDPKVTGQAFQLQSQANSLLKNHMLSNSFMNQGGEKQIGRLGHHQTEKEMWAGNTNLAKYQRMKLVGPIMIGETIASNMNNMASLQTQNQLQVINENASKNTVGRNMENQLRDQGVMPHNLNNMSAIL